MEVCGMAYRTVQVRSVMPMPKIAVCGIPSSIHASMTGLILISLMIPSNRKNRMQSVLMTLPVQTIDFGGQMVELCVCMGGLLSTFQQPCTQATVKDPITSESGSAADLPG